MSKEEEAIVKAARHLTMKTGDITDFQIKNLKLLALVIYGGPVTITITHREIEADFSTPFPLLGVHKQGDIKFLVPSVANQASPGLIHPQDELEMIKQGVVNWLGPKWTIEVVFNDDGTANPKSPTDSKRGRRTKTVRTVRKTPTSTKNKR